MLLLKVSQNEKVEKVFCAPGNGGTANVLLKVKM